MLLLEKFPSVEYSECVARYIDGLSPKSDRSFCILSPVQDNQEKQFIFRHSRSVFELLDADGSNIVSAEEFESFGFLFNFEGRAVRQIFREFDVSGDQV